MKRRRLREVNNLPNGIEQVNDGNNIQTQVVRLTSQALNHCTMLDPKMDSQIFLHNGCNGLRTHHGLPSNNNRLTGFLKDTVQKI